MRISWSDDEEHPGQSDLWQANCRRSLNGRAGQSELRALREALLKLPDKRLSQGSLVDEEGDVCAIGAYAKAKGLDLNQFDPEEETDAVGIEAGMPPLVAWKVVEMNDVEFASHSHSFSPISPEQRYSKMLAWVESQIHD
jgi:hypothetical protein